MWPQRRTANGFGVMVINAQSIKSTSFFLFLFNKLFSSFLSFPFRIIRAKPNMNWIHTSMWRHVVKAPKPASNCLYFLFRNRSPQASLRLCLSTPYVLSVCILYMPCIANAILKYRLQSVVCYTNCLYFIHICIHRKCLCFTNWRQCVVEV